MIWFFLGPYLFIMLAMVRPLAGHLAWFFVENRSGYYRPIDKPNGEYWTGAIFIALLLAPIWPVVILWVMSPISVGAERRADQRALKERIRELERETGLR